MLSDGLKKARVNFRYHDSFSSFLEGIFCRADRRFAEVIVKAYELGARLDAWTEHLNQEAWLKAFEECNVNPLFYLRERNLEETLPWDHLSCGIPKSYFQKEWKRATKDKPTPDCLTQSCSICGACDYDSKKNILWSRTETEKQFGGRKKKNSEAKDHTSVKSIYRMEYAKYGHFAFLGHLELVQIFHRAARRSGIPLAYSAGFHPMPRISFGPPVQLGVESYSEYADAHFTELVEPNILIDFFNQSLPEELKIKRVTAITSRESSITESIIGYKYRITPLAEVNGPLTELLASHSISIPPDAFSNILITRTSNKAQRGKVRKTSEKVFDLSQYISHFAASGDNSFEVDVISCSKFATPNIVEIGKALFGLGIGDYRVEKIATFFGSPKLEQENKINTLQALSL